MMIYKMREGGKKGREEEEEEEEWARGCWEREHFAPTGSGGAGTFKRQSLFTASMVGLGILCMIMTSEYSITEYITSIQYEYFLSWLTIFMFIVYELLLA